MKLKGVPLDHIYVSHKHCDWRLYVMWNTVRLCICLPLVAKQFCRPCILKWWVLIFSWDYWSDFTIPVFFICFQRMCASNCHNSGHLLIYLPGFWYSLEHKILSQELLVFQRELYLEYSIDPLSSDDPKCQLVSRKNKPGTSLCALWGRRCWVLEESRVW